MKLIDISHVLDEHTPVFPGDYQTALTLVKTVEKDFFNSYLLQSCLHTGTHIDLPLHFLAGAQTAAHLPLEGFWGNGVLLDVRGEDPIEMKPAYHRIIHEQDVVLLFTGYDRHYRKEEYFTRYPAVSDALADFLLSRDIRMLGMDMPAPDHSPYLFHMALLRKGIFVLENLTNLEALTGLERFIVMALPLKISAEASFVRAVCLAPDEAGI